MVQHIGLEGELEVVDGMAEGGEIPDLDHVPEEFAPGFDEEQFREQECNYKIA